MTQPNPKAPGAYKGQPWTLYDSVAAASFLLGDDSPEGRAIGTQNPAISRSGEMVFFSAGRTRATQEFYTNIDQDAQMAYGIEIWQMYIQMVVPAVNPFQSDQGEEPIDDPYGLDGVMAPAKLMEAIIQYGVLQLMVGQEEQVFFPLDRFGSGGGLVSANAFVATLNNGVPEGANVMQLPEAISIPRTQNLNAKIKLPPEVHEIIGSPAAPGVGTRLLPYNYTYTNFEDPPVVTQAFLKQPPYKVQLGLQGRRVKDTQYGQIAPGTPVP